MRAPNLCPLIDLVLKRARFALQRYASYEGGNSYRGLGIHVPARVMGQLVIFCPGYGSYFVNMACVCLTEICLGYG